MSRWSGSNAVVTNGARRRRRVERTPSVTFGDSIHLRYAPEPLPVPGNSPLGRRFLGEGAFENESPSPACRDVNRPREGGMPTAAGGMSAANPTQERPTRRDTEEV